MNVLLLHRGLMQLCTKEVAFFASILSCSPDSMLLCSPCVQQEREEAEAACALASMPDHPQQDVTSFKTRTHHGSGKKETYDLKARDRSTQRAALQHFRISSLLFAEVVWVPECDITTTVSRLPLYDVGGWYTE